MSDPVVVRDVVLSGDDLNFTQSPWGRITAANNQRLIPIGLGFLVSSVALGTMFDPTLVQIIWLVCPIALGFGVFIWVTNAVYLGAYKRAYHVTPTGREPCQFSFDSGGMHQSGLHHETRVHWSGFAEVTESTDGFRFWMTPFMAIVLPARFLGPGQPEALRSLIAAARADGRIKGV